MTNEFPVTQHPAKMGIPDLKSLYSQVWVRYPYFSFFKLCIFTYGFSAKDQIKVSRIPFEVEKCHLCMKGHLKLCLYSPFNIQGVPRNMTVGENLKMSSSIIC